MLKYSLQHYSRLELKLGVNYLSLFPNYCYHV